MNTDGILMSASGKGQANGEIISNGSAGSPITNLKGQGLGAGVAGAANGTFLVGNNVLSTHSISGSDGIGINEDRRTVGGTELDAPTLNVQVSNNTVSNYNGVGIHSLLRDSHGTGNVRISNNTVNAGEGSWVSGIYALVGSSGSASYNPTGCYDIAGNTSPQGPNDGFGNFPSGIVMDKFSSAAATYKFGIVGLSPSPTTAATAGSFVGGNNPSSALGAGFYAGKRASADNGDNFTSCTLPF
jgi:hypothetical protein